ncbi:hypothetical protein [Vibrio sp. HN007]|uniref:hypothetical protein n=1 Tax=Vibrio iocasae TaxID=3098914 RepID=UPI0035D4EF04
MFYRYILSLLLYLFSTLLYAGEKLTFSYPETAGPAESAKLIIREAYSRIGIEIDTIGYPGLRGLYYSNKGETDGELFRAPGLSKNYPNLVMVNVPLRRGYLYFYVKKGREFSVDNGWLSIPEGYLLGYRRGVKVAERAVKKYNLYSHDVKDYEHLLLQLEAGHVDVIYMGINVAERIMNQHEITDLVRLEPPVYISEVYHYLHKRHVDLIPRIESELHQMKEKGELDILNKKGNKIIRAAK